MPPSPDSLLLPRVPSPEVFTTTVFAGGAPTATTTQSTPSSPAPLPIGAIAGGLVAGVILALAAIAGWIWWGKSIEKQKRSKQPRIRSAMKQRGRGPPSANASKHSLPGSRPATNPMAAASQKSVTFAPSPRTSEDSEPPKTPSPTTEPEVQNEDKGKQIPRTTRETGAPRGPPPRSALRPPSGQRIQSAERAYAPSRPSPLAHASSPPPFARLPNARLAHQAEVQSPPAPHPLPPPSRQLTNLSTDRSSAVSSAISAPSEYSQDGTASEGAEPPFKMAHLHGGADARLYPHQEEPEASTSRQRGPPNITRIR